MVMRVEENAEFRGTTTILDANLNDGCIADDEVAAVAGIAATKLEHQHRPTYAQESDTTAASEDRVVHVVHGATGTIKAFKAGSVVANIGDSTVTVDLHVNGASVLTAVISLDNGDAAYDLVAAVVNIASLTVDDVLEVVVVATVGTGTLAKGVFAFTDIHEDES